MAVDTADEPQLPDPINGTQVYLRAILGVLRSIDSKLPARAETQHSEGQVELREPAAGRKGAQRGRG